MTSIGSLPCNDAMTRPLHLGLTQKPCLKLVNRLCINRQERYAGFQRVGINDVLLKQRDDIGPVFCTASHHFDAARSFGSRQ